MEYNKENNQITSETPGSGTGSGKVPVSRNQNLFSVRLKNRREKLKIIQKDLADFVGVTKNTYQTWEAKTSPSAKYIPRLAEKLSCSTDWLLKGVGEELEVPGEEGEVYNKDADHVATPEPEYDLHGGWKPRPEMEGPDWTLLRKTYDVITSNTVYREALTNNINTFHKALENEKRLQEVEKKCEMLTRRIEELEKQVKEKFISDKPETGEVHALMVYHNARKVPAVAGKNLPGRCHSCRVKRGNIIYL